MVPRDLDPKEAAARLPFRLLAVGLLLLMASVFLYNGVQLLGTFEPIPLSCSSRGSRVSCELGRALLSGLPIQIQGKVLGGTAILVSAFCFWLILVLWRGTRKR